MEANIYVDKVPMAIMARLTFAERLSAMDQPEEVDDSRPFGIRYGQF